MPRGLKNCPNCGQIIGNAAKQCRHCGHGQRLFTRGYVRLYKPGHPLARCDGHILEHRWLLYEMAIPVPRGHHIHHRNGQKDDNRWSNLEVVAASQHSIHHAEQTGEITNQYGTFPILRDPGARRERAKRRNAAKHLYKLEWQRRKRARMRGA